MALTEVTRELIPPSAMIGVFWTAAALDASEIAVIWGIPAPERPASCRWNPDPSRP